MSDQAIRPDPWLAALFERDVFRVDAGHVSAAELASLVDEHRGQQRRAFYYAKVDATEVPTVAALTADLATENDAVRLARSGAPVKQVLTDGLCHLEAGMLGRHDASQFSCQVSPSAVRATVSGPPAASKCAVPS